MSIILAMKFSPSAVTFIIKKWQCLNVLLSMQVWGSLAFWNNWFTKCSVWKMLHTARDDNGILILSTSGIENESVGYTWKTVWGSIILMNYIHKTTIMHPTKKEAV